MSTDALGARSSALVLPGQPWTPPIWANPPTQQSWRGPQIVAAPLGYLWWFDWSSSTFDLRPDLQSIVGNVKIGQPIGNISSRLYVLLTGPNATAFNSANLSVFATDFTQVYDANAQPGAGAVPGSAAAPTLVPQASYDVSAAFSSGGNTSLAGFAPPGSSLGGGEGYPIRYWRLTLLFRVFVPQDEPLPPAVEPTRLTLTAAMY